MLLLLGAPLVSCAEKGFTPVFDGKSLDGWKKTAFGGESDVEVKDGRIVTDRTVDSHVKNLRRKLEVAAPGHNPIRSVYGAGYSYEPEDSA